MKTSLLTLLILIVSLSFATAQQIESKKVFGGYEFNQSGVKLTMRSLSEAVSSNPESAALMKKARGSYGVANFLALVGGGLIGWPLGTAIAGGDAEWGLAGAGLAIVAIAIPLAVSSGNKAKQAVDLYNAGLETSFRSNFKPQLYLTGGPSQVGLRLAF